MRMSQWLQPENQDNDGVYFDASVLQEPEEHYVCWLDVMGTQAIMSRSLNISANFICKLHDAILKATADRSLRVYPMMDGAYVTVDSRAGMEAFLRDVFQRLASTFLSEKKPFQQFIPKASVAYGPVIHGESVPKQASWSLADNSAYRDCLLFGIPMIQSYRGEKKAPPFGVYIDESARAFHPRGQKEGPYTRSWWEWFDQDTGISLNKGLAGYFEWYRNHSFEAEYPRDRIDEHALMAAQYLGASKRRNSRTTTQHNGGSATAIPSSQAK